MSMKLLMTNETAGTGQMSNDGTIISEDLDKVFTRTFIFEINYQREKLKGNTEEEKYRSFLRMLQTDSYQSELQEAYPVLSEILSTRYKMIEEFLNEIRTHFETDREELMDNCLISESNVGIKNLQCTAGDTHNGAKRVILLTLSDGSKLIYKPHSLAVDEAFNDIARWFSRYLGIEIRTVQTLNKESYGWCSYVSADPCVNENQVRRYYYRYGTLIFLTKILGSTDLHYENLISSGEFPIIVDAELILGRGRTILDKASEGINELFQESVLHSGLLPLYAFVKSEEGVDVSAISGEAGRVLPLEIPTVVNVGRADVHIEYCHPKTAGGNNRCLLFNEFQEPQRFIREIKRGFRDSYLIAMHHKEELTKMINSFEKLPVRVLLRNTQTYSNILSISWHPRYLTKAGLREEMFEALENKQNPGNDFSNWQLKEEKNALLLGDIPYFYCYPDEHGLRSGQGGEYPSFFQETILKRIERRIETLCEKDINVQLYLIEATLEMGKKNNLPCPICFSDLAEISPENILRASEKLANMITERMMVSENGEIGWIQFSLAGYQGKGQMIRPAGLYLYNGLAGILLFFELLNRERRRRGYYCIQTYENICIQITRQLKLHTAKMKDMGDSYTNPTGLLNGEGSIVLLYQLMYRVDQDLKWLNAMELQCRILSGGIENDQEYDLLSGNAGAIMVFLNAYELTGNRNYIDEAVRAGEHLLTHAQKEDRGWCWKGSIVKKGLTGMAHGNAGILMALQRLAKYSGREDFFFAAHEAMRYEDSFYSAEKNDWMDLRLPPESVWDNDHTRAWCHGYGGIILSRQKVFADFRGRKMLKSKPANWYINKFTENIQHNSLCLCHGKAGDYALQFLSGKKLNALNELSELLGFILDDNTPLEEKLSVQERWNYGLMSGLSGIGYAILADRAELDTLFTGILYEKLEDENNTDKTPL